MLNEGLRRHFFCSVLGWASWLVVVCRRKFVVVTEQLWICTTMLLYYSIRYPTIGIHVVCLLPSMQLRGFVEEVFEGSSTSAGPRLYVTNLVT